jgi:hypothetical protein
MVAMSEDHPDAEVRVTIQGAVGESQLREHFQVSGVSLINPVQPDEKNMTGALKGDFRWFSCHPVTLTIQEQSRFLVALRAQWAGKAWTSARLHAHVLSPLRGGMFPGVDDVELFEFLTIHESPDTSAPN